MKKTSNEQNSASLLPDPGEDEDGEPIWPEHRIGAEEPPRGSKHPSVDPYQRDLQDSRPPTPGSILKDYAPSSGTFDVYPAYVDLADLPNPRLAEQEQYDEALRAHKAALRKIDDEDEREELVQEFENEYPDRDSGYDWSAYSARSTFPAPKILVRKDGSMEILDGNHRLTYFEQGPWDTVQVWVIQEVDDQEHAAMKYVSPNKYKSHFICYTDYDLEEMDDGEGYYLKQARKLIRRSEWPGFNEVKVVCLDESDPEDPTLAGVISDDGSGELLFLTVPEYGGQGVATLMVEALLPEVEGATMESVLDGTWDPPYHAIAGSEAGSSFMSSLSNKLGWKAWALIDWSGYEEERAMAYDGHSKSARKENKMSVLSLSPNLHQEWIGQWYAELRPGDPPEKSAFVKSWGSGRWVGQQYVITLSPEAERYLRSPGGPIQESLLTFRDRLSYADGDEEDDERVRDNIEELNKLRRQFPVASTGSLSGADAPSHAGARTRTDVLSISPELHGELLSAEIDTWSGDEVGDPDRAAFVHAWEAGKWVGDKYQFRVTEQVARYLRSPYGPLYAHDDIWEERAAYAKRSRDEEEIHTTSRILAEVKRLSKRFPKAERGGGDGGHAAARASSGRSRKPVSLRPHAGGPLVSSSSAPPVRGELAVRGFPKIVKTFQKAVDGRTIRASTKEWTKVAKSALPTLQRYGIELEAQLGCGSFACAYSIKKRPNLIAKFTGDPADAAAWQRVIDLVGRGRWPLGLARVEAVEVLPEKPGRGDRRMFFMLQERMRPLTSAEEAVFGMDAEEDPEDPKAMTRPVVDAILEGDYDYVRSAAEEAGASWPLFKNLMETVEWLRAQGIVWHDLHEGNVMAVGTGPTRRLKIMDLGYSEVPRTKIAIMDNAASRVSGHARASVGMGAHSSGHDLDDYDRDLDPMTDGLD